jgi:hypothetical protein
MQGSVTVHPAQEAMYTTTTNNNNNNNNHSAGSASLGRWAVASLQQNISDGDGGGGEAMGGAIKASRHVNGADVAGVGGRAAVMSPLQHLLSSRSPLQAAMPPLTAAGEVQATCEQQHVAGNSFTTPSHTPVPPNTVEVLRRQRNARSNFMAAALMPQGEGGLTLSQYPHTSSMGGGGAGGVVGLQVGGWAVLRGSGGRAGGGGGRRGARGVGYGRDASAAARGGGSLAGLLKRALSAVAAAQDTVRTSPQHHHHQQQQLQQHSFLSPVPGAATNGELQALMRD